MTQRGRSLFGRGFASPAQRLAEAMASESYDVPRPSARHPRQDRRRRTLRSRPRGASIAPKEITRALLASQRALLGDALFDHDRTERPRHRADCAGGPRPCPWVACRHHLYLDVNPDTGSIKVNFPDLEPWELSETCALDAADRGGMTLDRVGMIMNLTRERIRQMEISGLRALKRIGGLT